MIKEQDLLEAIAECQGERNPDAKTCIKLAAYYTILNQMNPSYGVPQGYSRQEPPKQVGYTSGTEFARVIEGIPLDDVLAVMDELMDALKILSPKLYKATLDKILDK